MTGKARVAVVVPTFQRREFVVQAIQSVVAQSLPSWQCIVVDNGSTDGTAEAVRGFGDARVKLITHSERLGPAGARNLALEEATKSDWVAFLDSDDLWAPRKLELQMEALERAPEAGWSSTACVHMRDFKVIGTGQFELVTAPGPEPVLVGGGRILARFERTDEVPVITPSVVVSSSLVNQAGQFDASMSQTSDWDYWLRLARVSPLVYLDQPLVAMRAWEGRISMTVKPWRTDSSQRARHLGAQATRRSASHRASWEQGEAVRHLYAEQRRAAAKNYVLAALYGKAPGQLAYAAASLAYPAAAKRRIERSNDATTPIKAWRAESEPWISAYRPSEPQAHLDEA